MHINLHLSDNITKKEVEHHHQDSLSFQTQENCFKNSSYIYFYVLIFFLNKSSLLQFSHWTSVLKKKKQTTTTSSFICSTWFPQQTDLNII